jgi:hypothetical protein
MASTHGVKLENSIDVDEKNYRRHSTDNDSQQHQKRANSSDLLRLKSAALNDMSPSLCIRFFTLSQLTGAHVPNRQAHLTEMVAHFRLRQNFGQGV